RYFTYAARARDSFGFLRCGSRKYIEWGLASIQSLLFKSPPAKTKEENFLFFKLYDPVKEEPSITPTSVIDSNKLTFSCLEKEPSLLAADTLSRPTKQPSSFFKSTTSTTARASTDNPPTILESQAIEDSYVYRSHSSLSYRTLLLVSFIRRKLLDRNYCCIGGLQSYLDPDQLQHESSSMFYVC
ncbi:hypothetical protein Tco_0104265, partial [Tanacetum coccineum]